MCDIIDEETCLTPDVRVLVCDGTLTPERE